MEYMIALPVTNRESASTRMRVREVRTVLPHPASSV